MCCTQITSELESDFVFKTALLVFHMLLRNSGLQAPGSVIFIVHSHEPRSCNPSPVALDLSGLKVLARSRPTWMSLHDQQIILSSTHPWEQSSFFPGTHTPSIPCVSLLKINKQKLRENSYQESQPCSQTQERWGFLLWAPISWRTKTPRLKAWRFIDSDWCH